MDAILKAVKKSPRPFGRSSAASSSKHAKLPENWQMKEPVKEGVAFHVKYLGSILVEELQEEGTSYGDRISAEAVKTIVHMAKMSAKKLLKMALIISTRGIKVVNMATKEILTDTTIYRISFCTADRTHEKVFAFIARNTDNETMECHAFLCPKRKIAQAVTLTVAKSFKVAEEEWEEKEKKDRANMEKRASMNGAQTATGTNKEHVSTCSNSVGMLIDISCEDDQSSTQNSSGTHTSSEAAKLQNQNKMGFDDDFIDQNIFNEDDPFSCLAQERIHPNSSQPGSPYSTTTNKPPPAKKFNPFTNFSTGLRPEDLDDGVHQLVDSGHQNSEFTRQPSLDDLFSL